MPQGAIKKLVSDKGFGFIEGDQDDAFFHHSAVEGTTFDQLKEVIDYAKVGDTLTFEVLRDGEPIDVPVRLRKKL